MANEKTKKTHNDKESKIVDQVKIVSPWAERIGVYLIGLITTLGFVLIMYTGVRAATYSGADEMPELLTSDDIILETEPAEDADETPNEDADSDEIEDETDILDETDTEDADSSETEKSTAFTGVTNVDGVFVREAPRTGENTGILVQLNEGVEITVLDSEYNADWMQVEYNGEVGYIFKDFIDRVE